MAQMIWAKPIRSIQKGERRWDAVARVQDREAVRARSGLPGGAGSETQSDPLANGPHDSKGGGGFIWSMGV